MLFLHGLGWDHTLWGPMLPAFTAAGYRVILGDTRGHGRSDKPEGPYSIALFAEDWDAAIAELGLNRPAIIGFSQGGMIAQALAVKDPNRFAALALVGTTCRASAAGREKMLERIEAARRDGAEASARVAGKSIFHPDFIATNPEYFEQFVAWRAAMPQEPILAATTAGFGFDVTEGLKHITVPTLVVAGTDDTLIPLASARLPAEHLPAATLIEIGGTGHLMPVEAPEALLEVLLPYMATQYPA